MKGALVDATNQNRKLLLSLNTVLAYLVGHVIEIRAYPFGRSIGRRLHCCGILLNIMVPRLDARAKSFNLTS